MLVPLSLGVNGRLAVLSFELLGTTLWPKVHSVTEGDAPASLRVYYSWAKVKNLGKKIRPLLNSVQEGP